MTTYRDHTNPDGHDDRRDPAEPDPVQPDWHERCIIYKEALDRIASGEFTTGSMITIAIIALGAGLRK